MSQVCEIRQENVDFIWKRKLSILELADINCVLCDRL